MGKEMSLLPEDLLVQILLRLPVKSLLRFKCVSKLWLSLISDPQFARSHFELAAARTEKLLFIEASTHEIRSIDLDASLRDDSASAATKLSFLLQRPAPCIKIMGSCRGFLLLWDNPRDLYLWNPSTGVHRQLPLPPVGSDMNDNIQNNRYPLGFGFLCGFGYDPSTDDYLVVLVSRKPRVAARATQFEFFSVRANMWGEIEGTHLPCIVNGNGIKAGSLLNEVIHWLALRHDVSMNVIIAFDLVERCFSEISLPNDFEYDSDSFDLWVHGGVLSLCVMDEYRLDIWVLKEYKVQSSWTKTISLPIIVTVRDMPTEYFSPICSTKRGDIIGMDGWKGLAKCNAKGELLEHQPYPLVYELLTCLLMQAAMYTESLLSLPGDSGQAEDEYDRL